LIKYIGSKRAMLPAIRQIVGSLPDVATVVDLFSGTSRVGHAMKRMGRRVLANDHNAYAATLARCYVQADAEDVLEEASSLIRELEAIPPSPGYFTETFCERSSFFQPHNGARIDAMRDAIERWELRPELESVLLVSLMEAADRVDSTTGVQMAYLKRWAPRSYNDISLRLPDVLPRARAGKGEAHCLDAVAAARRLSGDLAYIDPPYNQHKYLGNYHIWESLVLWDRPEVYGVACKRLDCRARRSAFNSKRGCLDAVRAVIDTIDCRYLLVSFNDEGHISREQMESLLAHRGHVSVAEIDYPRYVGAQIGIYNPAGERVGRVGHLRNTELLFLAGPSRLQTCMDDVVSRCHSGAALVTRPDVSLAPCGRRTDVTGGEEKARK
jgi:adenine-specific DNA-methyltransferase